MNKKLFIIGIGGLTGHKLAELGKNDYHLFGSYNLRNPKLEFVEQYKIDLTDIKKLKKIINEIDPNFIVNTSGINNVDYCEEKKEIAFKINVKIVEELTEICKSNKIKLIQLSSDSVFNGNNNKPYTENDLPDPINVYGTTKLNAEQIVLKQPENLVVRASVLYGWLPKKLTGISSSSMKSLNFAQWVIEKLNQNEKIHIVTDEFSSPVIVDDFAKSILYLIKKDLNGIFHSAPEIDINRYEFTKKIANVLKFDSNLVLPTTIDSLGRKVPTGKNKSLDSKKLIKNGFRFLTLQESLIILKKQNENNH